MTDDPEKYGEKNDMSIFSSDLFDIIEIWCEDTTESIKKCSYIYATEKMINLYPNDVILNNINTDKDHKLSNKVMIITLIIIFEIIILTF